MPIDRFLVFMLTDKNLLQVLHIFKHKLSTCYSQITQSPAQFVFHSRCIIISVMVKHQATSHNFLGGSHCIGIFILQHCSGGGWWKEIMMTKLMNNKVMPGEITSLGTPQNVMPP